MHLQYECALSWSSIICWFVVLTGQQQACIQFVYLIIYLFKRKLGIFSSSAIVLFLQIFFSFMICLLISVNQYLILFQFLFNFVRFIVFLFGFLFGFSFFAFFDFRSVLKHKNAEVDKECALVITNFTIVKNFFPDILFDNLLKS